MAAAWLSSAIREGLLAACGEVAVVMDADGQHEPEAVQRAVDRLLAGDLTSDGQPLSPGGQHCRALGQPVKGSERANQLAASVFRVRSALRLHERLFCPALERCNSAIRAVDVSGFKFLYELLAVSKGQLKVEEIPLNFRSRQAGDSKLDNAGLGLAGVAVHTATFRLLPRRAVSFGMVGLSGMVVHVGLCACCAAPVLAFLAPRLWR